ncbi:MAG: serine hydrolase domain-containing protein [Phycisphaerales bacterium]
MSSRQCRILVLAGTLLLTITCTDRTQAHCVIGLSASQQDESKRTFRFRSGDRALSNWNQASGIENPRTLASLKQHIQALSQEHGFSGAVLIAKDGKPILQMAVGLADFERGTPNTTKTPFNLGSGNKMFTAVAIAQLAQQGKLRLSDVISAHIPNYANKAIAAKVTIHHLLTHTSGVPDYWDDEYEKHWDRITSLRQMIPFFAGKPQAFEPGARFAYSNSNFIVLGLIIEAVTEQSYFDYVKTHIFDPLEMASTDSYLKDGSVRNLALGYVDDSADEPGGEVVWRLARHNLKGSSAGGGYSTLQDMLRFDQALRNGTLLSSESTQLLRSGKVPMRKGGQRKYGYGFIDGSLYGQRHVGHGGFGPGIFFQYRAFTELGYTAILFGNRQSKVASNLFENICELIARPGAALAEVVGASAAPKVAENVTVLDETPGDQERHWRVFRQLAQAMNNEDREAYKALFTPAYQSRCGGVFDFMVGQAMARSGNIAGFHAMSRPIKISYSAYPIRSVTFHLEDGKPGYFGIALDADDKIDHFSLFIKSDLCPNGIDPNCSSVVKRIDEQD